MLVNDLGTELLSTAVEAHELAALRSAINTVEGLEGLDQGLLQVRSFVHVLYPTCHPTPPHASHYPHIATSKLLTT